ncbi:MAG: hypothetical protein IPN79_10760 [Saprospiraceae bacterium]|nr:hypothetical protein [Saprospiraceae bacterium]
MFNSCYACGEEVLITFNLGIGGQNVPGSFLVYLTGVAQLVRREEDMKMVDFDGDNVYSIEIRRGKDIPPIIHLQIVIALIFSCKEVVGGQRCET